jgi:ribosome maturation factor RimP
MSARHDPPEATVVTQPAQRVREAVEPAVAAAGLVLEDVTVAAAGRRTVVRVVVDLDDDTLGSLDSDTLGAVSRSVSAALDITDPVRGAYVLEVSTPGTDRPLTELRHFRRARTRLVRLSLADGTVVAGRLVSAEPSGLEVDTGAGTIQVELGAVVRGAVEVELTHAADQEEGV